MEDILETPGRGKILWEDLNDIANYFAWPLIFGIAVYYYYGLGLSEFMMKKFVFNSNSLISLFVIIAIVCFLIMALTAIYNLLLIFLDILSGSCSVEKAKVLKIRKYRRG